ncbi:SMI1/KNR4 family protein [Planosporangium mesophilum]|uniref:SMI1/KNR4 family protein n=1 Tax=Planosporangium mesophilum TaxID=689768 RepID=A0A8J3TSJ2_9ACTN|nr:SMI1/KNR4 family protein [Planosporangium mesophilum]NJC86791.1 SMI1/KNR4 family protein [Planosporangium mesophilum]GII26505.1 hypothetical protein Pme01_61020 [Planosporangium mesophilum]
MPEDRVATLLAAVADGLTATAEQIRGLTEDEIGEIECDQPAPLAPAYRRFLELVGGGAGHFLQGSDVFYPRVIGLGDAARELLEENAVAFTLTDSDRVILMHQGYQFDFLRGTADDPEVWSYGEGSVPSGVHLSYPRFTDWLAASVRQQTSAWARLLKAGSPPRTIDGPQAGDRLG